LLRVWLQPARQTLTAHAHTIQTLTHNCNICICRRGRSRLSRTTFASSPFVTLFLLLPGRIGNTTQVRPAGLPSFTSTRSMSGGVVCGGGGRGVDHTYRQLIGRKQLQTTDMHGAPFPPPPGAHAHEHTHAHVRHTSLKQCSILYVPGVHGNITRFYWVWVGVNTGEATGCKNGRCGVANGWRLYPFFTRHERGPLLPPFLPVTHGPRFYPNPYGRYR
jgi:hypothetical protein